jgi:hypothetical protein
MHKAPTITARTCTVSANARFLATGLKCVPTHRLQTVLQSVLSTRIVLHTASVLRQEIVDSRATFGQNRRSTSMRFAEATIELVPEDAEIQEIRE